MRTAIETFAEVSNWYEQVSVKSLDDSQEGAGDFALQSFFEEIILGIGEMPEGINEKPDSASGEFQFLAVQAPGQPGFRDGVRPTLGSYPIHIPQLDNPSLV